MLQGAFHDIRDEKRKLAHSSTLKKVQQLLKYDPTRQWIHLVTHFCIKSKRNAKLFWIIVINMFLEVVGSCSVFLHFLYNGNDMDNWRFVVLCCILSTSSSLKLQRGMIFPLSPNGPHNYNIAGASSTLAPAQIGVTCRSPNVPVASEDNPTVTLNYRAEYLQPDW